jgi:hypothetical protein
LSVEGMKIPYLEYGSDILLILFVWAIALLLKALGGLMPVSTQYHFVCLKWNSINLAPIPI